MDIMHHVMQPYRWLAWNWVFSSLCPMEQLYPVHYQRGLNHQRSFFLYHYSL